MNSDLNGTIRCAPALQDPSTDPVIRLTSAISRGDLVGLLPPEPASVYAGQLPRSAA